MVQSLSKEDYIKNNGTKSSKWIPRHGLQNDVLKNDDYRRTDYISDEVLQKPKEQINDTWRQFSDILKLYLYWNYICT